MPKAGNTFGPQIPVPDYEEIEKQSKKAVLDALGVKRSSDLLTKGADELLVSAAGVIAQADLELAMYLEERDQALAHFWFYDPRRNLVRTAGLTYPSFRAAISKLVYGDKHVPLPDVESNEERAELGEKLRVRRLENAEEQLLNAAKLVRAAHARRKEAVPYMQQATLALSLPPHEWSPEKMAERAGVERTLVYNMRAAALKRQTS